MRRLAIGAHGTDVRHLQLAINDRSRPRGMPEVKVDDLFGHATRTAAERVARALGAREDTIARRPLAIGVQRMIRYPWLRTPLQLQRARDRAKTPSSPGVGSHEGSFGIDWAWGHPNLAQLAASGVKFACRYLSHDTAKNLTGAQARTLAVAGIDCLVVWETTANRALSGREGGAQDARDARAQAAACGIPDGSPIYFAVDFDEHVGHVEAVHAYFRGVHSVLGRRPVGVYGGYWTVKRLLDAGLVKYGWQTYAWSGGEWEHRAQLRQYSNGHVLGGVSCDYNRATADDFGQWRPT
jgi:hypothetical protein